MVSICLWCFCLNLVKATVTVFVFVTLICTLCFLVYCSLFCITFSNLTLSNTLYFQIACKRGWKDKNNTFKECILFKNKCHVFDFCCFDLRSKSVFLLKKNRFFCYKENKCCFSSLCQWLMLYKVRNWIIMSFGKVAWETFGPYIFNFT